MSFLPNSDMIGATMSQDSPLEIVIPTGCTQEHHDALLAYNDFEEKNERSIYCA
jgi:hypothetical protein